MRYFDAPYVRPVVLYVRIIACNLNFPKTFCVEFFIINVSDSSLFKVTIVYCVWRAILRQFMMKSFVVFVLACLLWFVIPKIRFDVLEPSTNRVAHVLSVWESEQAAESAREGAGSANWQKIKTVHHSIRLEGVDSWFSSFTLPLPILCGKFCAGPGRLSCIESK